MSGTTVGQVTRMLSGYLCGTHSGGHVLGRTRRVGVADVRRADAGVRASSPRLKRKMMLGETIWMPNTRSEHVLRHALIRSLQHPDVLDLVFFGSIARAATTGYSDVDAILIVPNDLPGDARRLRSLRSRALAVERAVLAYQPMQHHGLLVVTPQYLDEGSASALGMPLEAVETTRSLFGRAVEASFEATPDPAVTRFRGFIKPLLEARSWPRHAWYLHRLVSMFELTPTLYLQVTGRPTAKYRSFQVARVEFEKLWSPFDVLADVRERWPREPHRLLQIASELLRNPWAALAGWRRLSVAAPSSCVALLDEHCLRGLQTVVRAMEERAG